MSRLFDDAQSEYLYRNEAVLTGYPLAMVTWFNSDDDSIHHNLMWLGDKNVTNHRFVFFIHNATKNNRVYAQSQGGGAIINTITTAGYTEDTWHHACAIFASATDRRVFIDGGSKGTNSTDVTPTGLNKTIIGRWGDRNPTGHMSGMIAEVAIYDLSVWAGVSNSDKADNFE